MKSVLIAVLVLFPISSYAGTGNGLVEKIIVHQKNAQYGATEDVVMFKVTMRNDAPTCSGTEWAFSIETDLGKAMYAMLLSASAQRKSVFVQDSNGCSAWSDREHPKYITLEN